jgi:hypothetical protein
MLRFDGDGFSLSMTYDPKRVEPKIEFIEIKDRSLKRYWPDGVTRIKMEFTKPGLNGSLEMVFSKIK